MDTTALPSNDLSLERIHKIMDRMSQVDAQIAETTDTSSQKATPDFPGDGRAPAKTISKHPGASELVKEALATIGKLWRRSSVTDDSCTELDKGTFLSK